MCCTKLEGNPGEKAGLAEKKKRDGREGCWGGTYVKTKRGGCERGDMGSHIIA